MRNFPLVFQMARLSYRVAAFSAGALLLVTATAWPRTWHVAPAGDDAGPGNAAHPFHTISRAATAVRPGDLCLVHTGVYRETVVLRRSGTSDKPIRFEAAPGEIVEINGTDRLRGAWTPYKGQIFQTPMDRDVAQVFVDHDMMVEARWPNMRFPDDLWDRDTWARAGKGSGYGRIVCPELAKTGVDWTGAIAVLNITHQFYTWTRPVTESEVGRDDFRYPKDLGADIEYRYAKKTRPWEDDRFYLFGKLEALDVPTEWYLDRKRHTLYLWAPDSADPGRKTVEVKARDYGFDVQGDYIQLDGFQFFGCTFLFRSRSNHCRVTNCHLKYPAFARELLELYPKPRRGKTVRTAMFGDDNEVRNCSLAWTPVAGFLLAGRNVRIENCLIHDTCWTGSLQYASLLTTPHGKARQEAASHPWAAIIRGNTIFNAGNAELCFRGQPTLIENNHVYEGGRLCKDVALIYTGGPTCAGSVVRRNWAHGCWTETGGGLGIRGDDQTRRLTVHHNVVWDCGAAGIIVKGDFNRVDNNTILFIGSRSRPGAFLNMPTRPEPKKAWRRQFPLLETQNAHSEVFNNIARTCFANRSRQTPYSFAKNLTNNYAGPVPPLVAPDRLDFRPAPAASLIDAGRAIPGITDDFRGKAPDIGAYEFDGPFWKPGYRNGLLLVPGPHHAGKPTLLAALILPPLRPVTVRVEPTGARLRFTPRNWMLPQPIALTGVRQLEFFAGPWGSIKTTPNPAPNRVLFPEPDIGPVRPLDQRFKTFVFPVNRRLPQRAARPVARAFRAVHPIRVDGRLDPAEWPKSDPSHRLDLRSLDTDKPGPGSLRLLADDRALYAAFSIFTPPPAVPGPEEWGEADGIELDLQGLVGNKLGTVLAVHGFPSGRCEVRTPDAPGKTLGADGAARSVSFAATRSARGWTAEFRVPFAVLAKPPAQLRSVRFNAGARIGNAPGGPWFAWTPTGGANYRLDHAGDLVWSPACPVTAPNLVTNGGFEKPDLDPWHKANNRGKDLEKMHVDRVQEGYDGSWCIRMRCTDAELMKTGVCKWLFPLENAHLPAGSYILTYDLRVNGLKPIAPSGMFCSYIRTRTDPGDPRKGANQGQLTAAFAGPNLPWTRRDQSILVPEGARLSFLSLQLHRAVGTVWIDNVALCPARRVVKSAPSHQ